MMIPTQKMVLSAALGFALTAAPTTPAVKAAEPTPEVKALEQTIKDLQKDITDLKKSQETTRTFLYGEKDGTSGSDGVMKRLAAVEEKLKTLESTLNRIDQKLSATPSTSAASPIAGGASSGIPQPMAAAGLTGPKGTVRIVNEYPVQISLVLNGKVYRIDKDQVKAIEVPVGNYTYELLQSGAQATTSPIKDGETVTLRVR